MRLALHAPDIPQNTGTMLRLGACMGVACDLIGPAGFDVSDRTIRRAGLDYLEHVDITRHLSWQASPAARRAEGGRIVRLTTRAGEELWRLAFAAAMALGEAMRQMGRSALEQVPMGAGKQHASSDVR
jgi:tRNA (cytidine/uridine-2'-O-)-methyltransferase